MARTYYVFSEDLASALTGPFATRAEAEAHVEFCKARGDGAALEGSIEVISDFIVGRLDPRCINLRLTPDEDKAEVE